MTATEMIARLLLAALLGSIVGLERERLLWVAGLRTHMLVCVGATLFMLVSAYGFDAAVSPPGKLVDVSRVAAQIVSGIGFLGAGTILLRHDVIRGLTTAASLWAVAAIGMAVGGGMYVVAIAATLIILAILVALKPLESVLHKKLRVTGTLAVEIDLNKTSMAVVEQTIGFGHAQIRQSQTVANPNNPNQELRLLVTVDSIDDLEQLASTVRALRGVVSCTIG